MKYWNIIFFAFLQTFLVAEPKSNLLEEENILEDRLSVWNLEDIEAYATSNNPLYLSERQNISISRGDIITAALYYNPTLNVQQQFIGAGPASATGVAETSGIYFQPFDVSGVIPQRTKVAKQEFAASIARFEDFDRLFRLRLRQAYWSYLYVAELMTFQKEFLENYQDLLELTKYRADKGDISPLEFDRLELEKVQIEREYKNSRILRFQVIKNLRILLGVPESTNAIKMNGKLEFKSTEEIGINLKKYNIENRPDLRALIAQVQKDRFNIELKKRERVPVVSLGGEYLNKGSENVAGVYVSMPIPVFDRKQGEILKAEETAKRSQFQVEAKKLEIETEIITIIRELRAREAQLLQYTKEKLLDKNRKVQEKARYAYIKGAVPLVTFLEAERNYLSVLKSYYELIYFYFISIEQFKAAVGEISDLEGK